MTALALPSTLSAAQAFAERFRRFSPKEITRRTGIPVRTTEKWRTGESTPQFKHAIAILKDPELAREFLIAAERVDLANAEDALETIRKLRQVADEAGR